MASRRGSSDDEQTVNLIHLDSSILPEPCRGVNPCPSVPRPRYILDETLMQATPTVVRKLCPAETPETESRQANIHHAAMLPPSGRKKEEGRTFCKNPVTEHQSDGRGLPPSFEQILREKASLESEMRQALDKVEEILREKALLEKELRQGMDKLNEVRRQLDLQASQYEEFVTFYNLEYGTVQKQQEHLKKESARMQKELEEIRSSATSLKAERDCLQRKYGDLQKILEDRSAELAAVKAERDEANAECEKLFTDVHRLQREAVKVERLTKAKGCLQEQFEQVTLEADSLKSANAALEAQLSAMQNARMVSQSDQPLFNEECNENDTEIAMLKEKLQAAEQREFLLEETMKGLESDVQEHQRREVDMLGQIQSLLEQLSEERKRNSRLEDRVVSLENTCDAADATETEYKNQVDALTEEIEELRKQVHDKTAATENGDGDGSVGNHSGNNVFTSRSAIMETGQIQVLESEKYHLRKALERAQKQNKKLLEEVSQLKLTSHHMNPEKKENITGGGDDLHLRRANSECTGTTRHALQVPPMPHSAVDHRALDTSTNCQPRTTPRFFAPVRPDKKQ